MLVFSLQRAEAPHHLQGPPFNGMILSYPTILFLDFPSLQKHAVELLQYELEWKNKTPDILDFETIKNLLYKRRQLSSPFFIESSIYFDANLVGAITKKAYPEKRAEGKEGTYIIVATGAEHSLMAKEYLENHGFKVTEKEIYSTKISDHFSDLLKNFPH